MRKIVIAPDSFKGSLTAPEVADAMAAGVRRVLPQAHIYSIPMADGGEGTVLALVAATRGRLVHAETVNPLGDPIVAGYGILGDDRTAVIEMAAASGLPLIPPQQRNPLKTTTYGTGLLIRHALDNGCRKIIVGIGGSATNDAGTGMAQALGVRFFDYRGDEIDDYMCGSKLADVKRIDMTGLHAAVPDCTITAACDVDNPLLGKNGCAHVYASQKGATPQMVAELEAAMNTFANVLETNIGTEIRDIPGTGAAGGLGAGLIAFLNATLQPGIDLVLEACRFKEQIQDASLILTGEGKLDTQTPFGKTIAGITKTASACKVPVVAIAGSIEHRDDLFDMGLLSYFSICPGPISLIDAMASGRQLISQATERVMRIMAQPH